MSKDYLFLLVFLGVAIVFPLIPLGLAWLWARTLSPGKPGKDKQSSYECGIESTGPARVQFHSQYYLYGLVFLIFDVETVFLLPFTAAFLKMPVGGFLAMMVFLLLLTEGLVWAWCKGVLEWR